ncbi:MAG TPA: radical SAM protein [Verrucomicrobia bacterium]|nr:radical SAM protein [Verrucomicrobiota bacterium]
MLPGFAWRLMTETHPRLLARFAYQMGWKGSRSVAHFQKQAKNGVHIPPFLFISITTRCNLRCQGCWVDVQGPPRDLDPEVLDRILSDAEAAGCAFFGILGGEPLLYPRLFEILGRHRSSYFQLFTNGTVISRETAEEMRRLGNVTPLISLEGNPVISDVRRGGIHVFDRSLEGLHNCRQAGLVTGVATSLCRSNFDDFVQEEHIAHMIELGVHYLWYYIYRPAGPRPTPELALSKDQIQYLRSFLVQQRPKHPILIIDAYWDQDGNALCPAASGISYHINPFGDIEPCPPIQMSDDHVADGREVIAKIRDSNFLRDFRTMASHRTRGCIIMEDPALLRAFAADHNAHDSSGRGTYFGELEGLRPCPGHHQPGEAIPETHWLYRIAKKNWFFGFGAYG